MNSPTPLPLMPVMDRWLCADECATYFGLKPARRTRGDAEIEIPNRRGFLQRLASLPDFPKPLTIGNEKKWKLSELEEWADEQRRAA